MNERERAARIILCGLEVEAQTRAFHRDHCDKPVPECPVCSAEFGLVKR